MGGASIAGRTSSGVGEGVGIGDGGAGAALAARFISSVPRSCALRVRGLGVGVGVGFRYFEMVRPTREKKSPIGFAVTATGEQQRAWRRPMRMNFWKLRIIRAITGGEIRRTIERSASEKAYARAGLWSRNRRRRISSTIKVIIVSTSLARWVRFTLS